MWLMLQQDKAEDYVVSSGEMHSVRELCEVAFSHAGLDMNDYVVVDPAFYRPAEVHELLGDSSKAKKDLGWAPQTSFEDLVEMMVTADLKRVQALKDLNGA